MKKIALLLTLPVFVACSGGGGDTLSASTSSGNDSTTQSTTQTMSVADVGDQLIADGEELTLLLSGIVDVQTAEAAKPRIHEIIEGYQFMDEKLENMGNPSLSDMAALASLGPKIATNQKAVVEEIARIYHHLPEAYDVLAESLGDLNMSQ